MSNQREELIGIISKFAESGWSLLDSPSQAWLDSPSDTSSTEQLITAIEAAYKECGNCGCEFDALYLRALELLTSVGV